MKFCVNCVHLQPGNLCTSPQRPADMVTGSQLPMDAKKVRTDPKMCTEFAVWFARKHKEEVGEPDKAEPPTINRTYPGVRSFDDVSADLRKMQSGYYPTGALWQFNADDIAKTAQQNLSGDAVKQASEQFAKAWNNDAANPVAPAMKAAWANPYPNPTDSIKDPVAGFRPDMKSLMDKMLDAQREFLARFLPKE